MIIPAVSDVAFSIYGFNIYYYGVIMAFAVFVAILVANCFFNKIYETKRNIILDFSPILIISGILGARIYFCMLNPSYYLSNPLEILDIREGGLSIHGAIIGGVLSLIIISQKYKIPFLKMADSCACATILGQAVGRWGNYFNSEAYGLPVDGQNWGLYIPLEHRVSQYFQYSLFHPTFLYESIFDLIGFGVLVFIFFKFGKKYKGLTLFSYFAIYALIRFFIEQIRIDSALNIGSIPIALIASGGLFFVGIVGILFVYVKNH